jgi:biopolymer transport protein ExbD
MGPLIDVVFLLLIFFLLVGTAAPPEPIKVDPATSESDDGPVNGELVVLLSADGRLAFEGQELERTALARALRQRLAEGAQPTVQLKADARLSAQEVIAVLDLLRGAGIDDLVLLTMTEASS